MNHDRFLVLNFREEATAKAYLRQLLKPYFAISFEIECRHLIAGNTLRIDYVARPLPGVDFPFEWFGGEIKRSISRGEYNRALKQCVDYTNCEITDPRVPKIQGQRIERVYLFPGLPDTYGDEGFTPYWINRAFGLFHVGLIYTRREQFSGKVEPFFLMSSDRQWSPNWGAIKRPHNIHQRVGSGVPRLRVVK